MRLCHSPASILSKDSNCSYDKIPNPIIPYKEDFLSGCCVGTRYLCVCVCVCVHKCFGGGSLTLIEDHKFIFFTLSASEVTHILIDVYIFVLTH